jgi:hypothetical protein
MAKRLHKVPLTYCTALGYEVFTLKEQDCAVLLNKKSLHEACEHCCTQSVSRNIFHSSLPFCNLFLAWRKLRKPLPKLNKMLIFFVEIALAFFNLFNFRLTIVSTLNLCFCRCSLISMQNLYPSHWNWLNCNLILTRWKQNIHALLSRY